MPTHWNLNNDNNTTYNIQLFIIMKKLTTLFLFALLSTLMASAQTLIDGVYYNLIAKQAEVTSGDTKYTGNVTIPESFTYNGVTYSVTSIEYYAFYNCSGLTSVTIPNSVTSIGYCAFYFCSGLTSVTIPNGVTSIEDFAFSFCSGLTSVTIPNSVTSIEHCAFQCCSSLTSIEIPNSVTSIGGGAFHNCSGLTSVTIPNSVTSIGSEAFSGCSGLTSISVENGNEEYDSRDNCNAIIETASNTLIAGCNNTVIPNSVTSIREGAFYGCSGFTSITIPNSVTSIESRAFGNCSGLTSIEIPNNVTSIGSSTFSGCFGLTSVTIPNSVTSIGDNAFSGCYNLTSVTIPNSVTSIGSSAFLGCSGLTSVIIPNSVTSIGSSAFKYSDLTSVISLIENPFAITGKTSDSRTFTENTFNNATLYVPKGTIEKYKATDGWKDFVFMEEGEGPGGDTPETQKCATPTISYENGKLTFDCETEGVEYVSSITPPSAFNSGSKTVSMPTTYKVTVYATKAGYENSDEATLDINVSGGSGTSGVRGDVNLDGEVSMPDAMFIVNKILNGKFPDE